MTAASARSGSVVLASEGKALLYRERAEARMCFVVSEVKSQHPNVQGKGRAACGASQRSEAERT